MVTYRIERKSQWIGPPKLLKREQQFREWQTKLEGVNAVATKILYLRSAIAAVEEELKFVNAVSKAPVGSRHPWLSE